MTGLRLRAAPARGGKQDLSNPVAHGSGLSSGHGSLSGGGDLGVLAWAHGGVEAGALGQGLGLLRCSHVTKPTRPRSRGQINAHPMLDGANLCAYIRTMKTTKLSPAQQRMLLTAADAGGMLQWMDWGNRHSGRSACAWDRTASTLQAAGLLTTQLSPSRKVTLTDAGRARAATLKGHETGSLRGHAMSTPILYTRLTPADLVAIAASSGDEVTHLRAMVEALAGCICRRHHSEMIADGAIFAAIESAAGAAMCANADGDCVVEVRR